MDAEEPRQRSARGEFLVLLLVGSLASLLIGFVVPNPIAAASFAGATFVFLMAWSRRQHPRDSDIRSPLAKTADAMLPDILRGVFARMTDPILVLAQSGEIVFANPAARTTLGPAIERKHIASVLRTPSVLEAVERVLAGTPSEIVAFSFLVPVERHFEALVTRFEREDDAGGAFVFLQLHDITPLRRSQQMRADFVADVSHELRTPLAAVAGFIETLQGPAKEDAKARERFLEIMNGETGRMRRLIEDLLSLSRIEMNEHNPPQGAVDVTDIARNVVTALNPLAKESAMTVEVAKHDALWVAGAADELTQVFQNLVHNAIKYGRRGGKVRIAFGRTSSNMAFAAVSDDGEGIPREAIPRLTERFFRVNAKESRERGGTGLGLAIVKHILNRHRGRLQIESTLGQGSTFTVLLPLAAESTQHLNADAAGVMKV